MLIEELCMLIEKIDQILNFLFKPRLPGMNFTSGEMKLFYNVMSSNYQKRVSLRSERSL